MSYKSRAGDWNCSSCGFKNFASRNNCKNCNKAKSAGSWGISVGRPTTKKPGDWNCSRCNYVNFGSRNKCNKCNTAKVKKKHKP